MELICRTCLSNASKFESIYTMSNYHGKTFTILKMIMACAPVDISEDDGLPSNICEKCLQLLQISFMFRVRILQANAKLKDYLRTKLISDLQPLSEDLIEPLVFPSVVDKDVTQEQVSQTTDNENDPLLTKPNELSGMKNDTMPFEEVMLSTSSCNYSTDNTNELPLSMAAVTEFNPVIHERNTNFTNEITSSIEQLNNVNIEYDSNVLNLSANDTMIIQNIIQTIQSKHNTADARYIVVKANQPLDVIQNKQIEPAAPICEQNTLLSSSSQSNIQSNTSNKNINLTNNTPFNNNSRKPEKLTFEDELKKFVYNRHKSDAISKGSWTTTGSNMPPRAVNTLLGKKKSSEPLNIDLSSDNINVGVLPKKPTIAANNSSQSNSSSLTLHVPQGMMMIQDDGSFIIIDD